MESERYAAAGLCSGCEHAVRQPNARGSSFWRCRAADTDASLLRYPPLPVTECHGFRPGSARPDSPGEDPC
jgi:hypothetical protein